MSFLGWLFGEDDSDDSVEFAPCEASLSTVSRGELAAVRDGAARTSVLDTGSRLVARADALIPAGVTAVQAATEYGMAVVGSPRA